MWEKLRYKISVFMYGRYGLDELGKLLFVIGIVTDIIGMITKNPVANAISLVAIVLLLSRFFSKDIYKRKRENAQFRGIIQLVITKFQLRRDYRVFRCRKCNRNIRVPRNHGKIEVTCPLCGEVKMIYSGPKKKSDF